MAASRTISTKKRLLRSLLLLQSSSYSNWTTKAWEPKFLRNQQQSPAIPEHEQLGFCEPAPSVPERQNLGFPERTPSLFERDQPKFPEPAKVPPEELAGWPRPSEIAWEGKVPNSVNLIGSIKFPVQLEVSSDGRYWALTVLVLEKLNDFPKFWIPITFEGNLAQIAVCHLRENDLVYVTGQLIGDPPVVTLQQGRINNIQVMVQNLYFVQTTNSMQKTQTPGEKNEQAFEGSDRPTKSQDSMESCWRDIIANPKQWWDYRMAKDNGSKSPKYPDFQHKNTRVALWLDRAPQWVLPALEKVDVTVNPQESCWRDFITNPKQWWDNRQDKANGLNPNYPDFKHKDSGMGLWLIRAPLWVLSALEGLDFPVKTQNPEHGKAKHGSPMNKTDNDRPTKSQDSIESCWRDIIANPKQWWDYRMAKDNGSKSPKYPDFQHKNTRVALWLDRAPQWVLPALEKVDITVNPQESCWRDFIANPKQWWDNRQDKANGLNPNYPDFKHKDSGMGLWLIRAPLWVLSALEGLDFPMKTQNPEQGKVEHGSPMNKTDNAELWMNLAYNPDGWWDYRSTKVKASVPDFKNKETGEKLWLNSATPSWILPYLPPEKCKVDSPSSKRDSPSSEET